MPRSDSPTALSEHTYHSGLKRIRRISHLLDNAIAIPGIGYRIGLDPLVGLLPGGGDLMTGLISIYIVAEAARLGVPAATLGRMGLNILVELVIGTMPMVGDLFDVVWKANAQNVALVERHIRHPRPRGRADTVFAILLIAVLSALVIGIAALSLMIVRWVLQL